MGLKDWLNCGKTFEPTPIAGVEVPTDLDAYFAKARVDSLAVAADGSRNIVLITPGRLLMCMPCPRPNSMAPAMAQDMLGKLPGPPKNVVAIVHNALEDVHDPKRRVQSIPFLGFLLGFGYVGHSVIMFEGHPTALAASLKDADLLMVDEAMISSLQPDWVDVAYAQMRTPKILVATRDQQMKQIVKSN